jgi:hypothetical protein
METFSFTASPFVPVAIGFFGLGTGYFIWGGQALCGSRFGNDTKQAIRRNTQGDESKVEKR